MNMKLEDLRNGDIAVVRDGQLAMVQGEVLFYDEGGFYFLDESFDDDLKNPSEKLDDIMRLYRGCDGCRINFDEFGDGFVPYESELIYERDPEWRRPTQEERDKRKAEEQARREQQEAEMKARMEKYRKESIRVMIQAFYGNRVITGTLPEQMDGLILGNPDGSVYFDKPVARTIVRIPGTDNLVLIYNRFQEEEMLRDNEQPLPEKFHPAKPLAVIPELGLELYSRCLVCRMNDEGKFESLEKEDLEKFIHYLAE